MASVTDHQLYTALSLLQQSIVKLNGTVLANTTKFGAAADPDRQGNGLGPLGTAFNPHPLDGADVKGSKGNPHSLPPASTPMSERLTAALDKLVGGLSRGLFGARGQSGGGIARAVAQPFAMLARMLGPIAIVSAIISSGASGFQTVSTAFKLLATVLAPVLLPVMLLFATLLVQLSTEIHSELMPALRDFFTYMLKEGLPAVKAFVEGLGAILGFVRNPVKAVTNDAKEDGSGPLQRTATTYMEKTTAPFMRLLPSLSGTVGAFRSVGDEIDNVLGTGLKPRGGDAAPAPRGGSGDFRGATGSGGGFDGRNGKGDKTLASFDMVLKSFANSIGPKASFQGFADRSRTAQLSALNADPIEQQMLKATLEILGEMRAARTSLDKPAPPTPRFTPSKSSIAGGDS